MKILPALATLILLAGALAASSYLLNMSLTTPKTIVYEDVAKLRAALRRCDQRGGVSTITTNWVDKKPASWNFSCRNH